VGLQGELQDLNVKPITMDRESDSPHRFSPTAAAALDAAVSRMDSADEITAVLQEVRLIQPPLPQLEREPSPGARTCTSSKREKATKRLHVVRLSSPPKPSVSAPSPSYPYPVGCGIQLLHAPPKLARLPAPRRLLPCTSELPKPQ